MPLRPLGSQILCERLPEKNYTPGGIFVYDRDPTYLARVIATGPLVTGIHPGETLVFLKSQYEISEYEGREVLFVNDDNAIAVFGE